MSQTILHIDEIVSNPNVRGGRPVIRGTGLKVSDVWLAHTGADQLTPEEIATNYRLQLGQVYAAFAYYHLHQDEIDAEIEQDEEAAQQLLKAIEAQGKLTRLD